MVKRKVEKIKFICGVAIVIIFLSGCGEIEQQTFSINLDAIASDHGQNDNSQKDYSSFIKYLTNDQGDIFYEFLADFQHDSEILEVVVEDMDGDGLKDVEVVTFIGGCQFEWYFFQKENELFAWEVTIVKEDGISKWIRFKRGAYRECSDGVNE